MNDFRHSCLDREKLVGTFAAIPHPVGVEVTGAGRSRLHLHRLGACPDRPRHDRERACAPPTCHGVPAIVRVPGHAPEAIAAALDSGAAGVLVPRVSTAAQAAAAVKASRYPPAGERGVGPGRAAGYGYRILDYLAAANAEVWSAVQVETAEGLANADAIAATDGVDLSSSARAISPCRSARSAPTARPGSARRSGRSSPRPAHARQDRPASSARRRKTPAAGPAAAPAFHPLPATPCSSAPAPRRRHAAARKTAPEAPS